MKYRAPTLNLGRIVNTRDLLTMDDENLQTHLYILGATRTGKTKFMENLLRQIIVGQRRNGPGLLLLDPHGTLYNDLARYLADRAVGLKRPVLFLDPSRDDFVVPYNILRRRTSPDGRPAEPSVVARQVLQTLSYVWGEAGTQATPLFHRMAINLLLTLYLKGYTTNEAYHFLYAINRDLRRALTEDIERPTVAAHWEEIDAMRPRDFMEVVQSTLNRFQPLVDQPRLTRMFGHPDRSIDFRRAIDEGWIILCNLSTEKSQIHEDDAHLLGTLLLADLWATAKDRGKAAGRSVSQLRPFVVAVDEVQNFITPTIAKNLAEASGFGLRLILAHQYPGQLTDDPKHQEHGKLLFKSLLTNARNKVVFGGIGSDEDLAPLAEVIYRGVLDPDEIKHTLYGTKVLDYKLEYERAYHQGDSSVTGGGSSTGTTSGSASIRSAGSVLGTTYGGDGNILGTSYTTSQMDAFTSSLQQSAAESSSWADGHTEGVSDVPMLKPILGKELTSVQFRDLEEQRYRAMATLFDQKQRQCVVRLVAMHEPAVVFTPFVEDGFSSNSGVHQHIAESYQDWPDLALPADEATRLVEQRRRAIEQVLQGRHQPARPPRLPRATIEVQAPMLEQSLSTSTPAVKIENCELQARDLALLVEIYEDRFITIEHAAKLHFGNAKSAEDLAKRRLAQLAGEAGLLKAEPVQLKRFRLIYRLTKAAVNLLAEHGLIPQFTAQDWEGKLRKRCADPIAASVLQHEIGLLDIKAALQSGLANRPHLKIIEFGIWPLPYQFVVLRNGRPTIQKPDGFLHVAEFRPNEASPRSHYFYLELDRGSQDLDKITAKVEAYRHHLRKGGFLRHLGLPEASIDDHPFRVLFILETKEPHKRRHNILERLAQVGVQTRVSVTSLSELLADPLGPIWLTPAAYRHWLAGDPSPPLPFIHLFE